ncbi:hypothetical protein GCM10010219_24150 [Streptomyces netropsis]|nr:hypothetical protein GCM10010219_24150 [Streptomyces netropsis]
MDSFTRTSVRPWLSKGKVTSDADLKTPMRQPHTDRQGATVSRHPGLPLPVDLGVSQRATEGGGDVATEARPWIPRDPANSTLIKVT